MATSVSPKPTNKKGTAQHVYAVKLLLCSNCAQLVLPVVNRLANGRVTGLDYYHVNEEVGCEWKMLGEVEYARQESVGLQEYVRSGNDEHGKPKYINEKDMAAGKSFDVDDLKPKPTEDTVIANDGGSRYVVDVDEKIERAKGQPPTGTFAKAAEAMKQRIRETDAEESLQPPAQQPPQNVQESDTEDGA